MLINLRNDHCMNISMKFLIIFDNSSYDAFVESNHTINCTMLELKCYDIFVIWFLNCIINCTMLELK